MPRPLPPVPATGLPAGVETGPLDKRAAAQLIDVSVPVVLLVLASVTSAAAVTVLAWVLSVGWFIVVWEMVATRAASPGMRLLKLQLVGLRNGRPIGWARFLVRSVILAALTITVVGLVVMLVRLVRQPRKQGWHDLVAESVVIKQRSLAPSRAAAVTARRSTMPDTPTVTAPAGSPVEEPTPAGSPVEEPTPAPSPAEQPQPADDVPDRGWLAVLDDGRQVEVSGLVLLGRNPQARPGEEDAELVKVADDTRTVSKTHLALSADPGGLYVMDRGSTNGTRLTTPPNAPVPCPAGDVLAVEEGSMISFGDHWLTVERQPDR